MSPAISDACAVGLPGSTSSRTRPKAWPLARGSRTGWTATPSHPLRGPPAIKSRTALLGMASARRPATIVLIPITWPRASASGPPELPGASRTLACTQVWEPSARKGPMAWITPVVSAPTKPIGLPMAMAISLSFVRTVADSDAHVAHGASAKNLRGQRFANVFGLQVRLDIFGTRNGVSRQRDQDVTDDDASLVGRPIGLNFENDGSGFLFVLHRLAQLFRETDRLQSHAEIPARDAAFFQ